MANKQGKQYEKDMLKSVRSWGWWAERFRDNTWNSMAGSNASPPDMICVRPRLIQGAPSQIGTPVLMELKAVKSTDIEKASIHLGRCAGHQLERLMDFPGESYVGVMFYEGDRAQKRTAVLIPLTAWVGAQMRYGRLSVRLDALREDLPAQHHLRWVGRGADIGPWVRCTQLGTTIKEDQ